MNVATPPPHDHQPGHILYVITKANWGGAQRYVYDLAVATLEKGYEVTVACGAEGELSERLMHKSIPVIFVEGLGRDVAPLADIRALSHLTRLMKTLKPDVVHVNSSKAGLLAGLAARFARVPRIIFTAHGWAFNESRPGWQKGIFAIFHLLTVWSSDTVICVSEAVRRDAKWMPFAKRKFVVIHHGVVPGKLVEKDEARAYLAPHLSLELRSSSTVWIGTLAELHRTKGLDIAILAFAAISKQHPNAVLVLIGDGQARTELSTLSLQQQVSSRVYFCGHVNHASSLLSAFDIFLFPSRSEALGYAALEAGLASLPVIASNVGGIPEIIENEKTGLLVPVDDISGFANAITALIKDQEERSRLGTGLHESVLKNFSKSAMLEETLSLYSSN